MLRARANETATVFNRSMPKRLEFDWVKFNKATPKGNRSCLLLKGRRTFIVVNIPVLMPKKGTLY